VRHDVTPEPESALEATAVLGKRAPEGEKFPALKLEILRPRSSGLSPLDLADEIGKRPVVFVYFLMEYQISEDILTEVREFVRTEARGKVALYPVTRLGKGHPLTELTERIQLLGIEEPVIVDRDSMLQHALGVGVVPSIALIDHMGIYCFKNATSLKEVILDGIDLRESIKMAVRGEDPPVVVNLQTYYPVNDFIGSKFMDLVLPDYKSGDALKLSDHVKPGRLTAIIYWSPHCLYSRKIMPAVVLASRNFHEKFLDVISVVRMKSGETREGVGKYAADAGISFPILEDKGHRFTNAYRVTSTPTLIIIRPDGVVDSVYSSSASNFFSILMTKINTLVAKPPAPSPAADPLRSKSPASGL